MKQLRTSGHEPRATSQGKSEIVFGIHAVKHTLERHPEAVLEIRLQEGRKITGGVAGIMQLAERHALKISRHSREVLDNYTEHAAHQGVVLTCRKTFLTTATDLQSVLAGIGPRPALLLLLEGIQDPHNLGACLRTANAAGVDAVIIPRDRAVTVNATVRKVASGAAEETPVISITNVARCLRTLKQQGLWIVGTDSKAGQRFYDIDLTVPLVIVLGAEGGGMRKNTRAQCDFLMSLPMLGRVESLNVSVTTGICLYEVLRQRTANT